MHLGMFGSSVLVRPAGRSLSIFVLRCCARNTISAKPRVPKALVGTIHSLGCTELAQPRLLGWQLSHALCRIVMQHPQEGRHIRSERMPCTAS